MSLVRGSLKKGEKWGLGKSGEKMAEGRQSVDGYGDWDSKASRYGERVERKFAPRRFFSFFFYFKCNGHTISY